MEVALVRFIGAGLALLYEGFGAEVPVGSVASGHRFLAEAAQAEPQLVLPAIERTTADIWNGWRMAKLPRPVAKTHLEALPDLMDRYRVAQSQIIGAVASAKTSQRTGSQAPGHSARIASAIIAESKAAGQLQAHQLNESIAFFFLERLLAQLLKELDLFARLQGNFATYAAARSWEADRTIEAEDEAPAETGAADADAGPTTGTPEHGADAHESREPLPVAAASKQDGDDATSDREAAQPVDLARFRDEIASLAASHRVPAAALTAFLPIASQKGEAQTLPRLEEITRSLRSLLALLAEPQDQDSRALTEEAREHLAEGRLDKAERSLAVAEDRMTRGAQASFSPSTKMLTIAAELRGLRGVLAETSLDFSTAADHYATAARNLPASNRNGRWQYLVSQALALERAGRENDDTSSLIEAAQVHSDAIRLISEQEAPSDWAMSHLALGNLLILLGRRERRSERYVAAALHFNPAIDVFDGLGETENKARAQAGLGQALHGQGEVQGDVELLTEAMDSLRAALEILTPEQSPDDWLTAKFELGATLLRIGQEAGDIAPLEEAAQVLGAIRQTSNVGAAVTRGQILAKLGHTLLALGAARSDLDMIAEAAAALEDAVVEETTPLPEAATAAALDALGSALLVLAETENDLEATLRAAEAKEAALSYYQSVGEDGLVESLSRELEEIVARLPETPPAPSAAEAPHTA